MNEDDYQPGNGTRYLLLWSQHDGNTIVIWTNPLNKSSKTISFPQNSTVSHRTLDELWDCGDGDHAAILAWINQNFGNPVIMPKNFNKDGHYEAR